VRTPIATESNTGIDTSAAKASNPASAKPETPSTVETLKKETIVEENPVVETLAMDAPIEEAPAVETPAMDAPIEENPVVETPAMDAPIEETPAVETPAMDAPIEEAPAVETPAMDAPSKDTPTVKKAEKNEKNFKITILLVVLATIALIFFISWYTSDVQKGSRRFDAEYGSVEYLNSLPAVGIYHFDGKWEIHTLDDNIFLQNDPLTAADPKWVSEGLEILKGNPETAQKQALFAAYFKKYAKNWENPRRNAVAVLGAALFENASNYSEEELKKIEICFIRYAENMTAINFD
jgi:hypothetical protein